MAKTSKKNCNHPRWARYGNRCDKCGREDVTTPVGFPAHLHGGVYRLTEPVDNTDGKDGRSSDWDKQPQIEPGYYYVLGNESQRIMRANSRYASLNERSPAFDDVMKALVPVETVPHDIFLNYIGKRESYAGDADVILEHMLKSGKVTQGDILNTMDEIRNTPEED